MLAGVAMLGTVAASLASMFRLEDKADEDAEDAEEAAEQAAGAAERRPRRRAKVAAATATATATATTPLDPAVTTAVVDVGAELRALRAGGRRPPRRVAALRLTPHPPRP